MKPSYKAPKIEQQVDSFTSQLFGKSRTDAIRNNVCVTCDNTELSFRDELSIKEYTISGMCQNCQDEIFN